MIYVALLYSIVLGGGRRVVMSDLRAMAEDIGYTDCRTLVSTGNLVFEGAQSSVSDIEKALETAFARRFGKHVDILVRSRSDWLKLAAANPFPGRDGSEVGVRIMRTPLDESVKTLLERHREREQIAVVDGNLWVDFGGKASETRLLSAMTTKKLGIGTARNANTVARLAEMVA